LAKYLLTNPYSNLHGTDRSSQVAVRTGEAQYDLAYAGRLKLAEVLICLGSVDIPMCRP